MAKKKTTKKTKPDSTKKKGGLAKVVESSVAVQDKSRTKPKNPLKTKVKTRSRSAKTGRIVKPKEKPKAIIYSFDKAVQLKESMAAELVKLQKDVTQTVCKTEVNGDVYEYVLEVKADGSYEANLK